MSKYFGIPFADSGDKTAVPDALQPGGNVSYTEGWTPDYEADQGSDPNAKDVSRLAENQLKNDITGAIKELQETGFKPYSADVNYPTESYTIGNDGQIYTSIIANGPLTTPVSPVGDASGTWAIFTGPDRKNSLLNGCFTFWRRGTSTNSSNAYLSDRWLYINDVDGGASVAPSTDRITFPIGQTDVPGNPKYYARVSGTIAGGGGAESSLYVQRVEDVNTHSNEIVTVSFYAKSSGPRSININLAQNFGTGGTPSATVYTNVGEASLTTNWQRFVFFVSVPSTAGKNIGTNNNDYLGVTFVLQAGPGSSYTETTASAESVDLSCVDVRTGSTIAPFDFMKNFELLPMLNRYYVTGAVRSRVDPTVGNINAAGHSVELPVTMRALPTISTSSVIGTLDFAVALNQSAVYFEYSATGPNNNYGLSYSLSSEL